MVGFSAPTAPRQAPEAGGCPWCGGIGVDLMTGEMCEGCTDPHPADQSASARRQRRHKRAESATTNLRGFMVEASLATTPKRRTRRIPSLKAADLAAKADEAKSPAASRSSKVKFDLDGVLEYPVTPYAEKTANLPDFHDDDSGQDCLEDGDTSEDSDVPRSAELL